MQSPFSLRASQLEHSLWLWPPPAPAPGFLWPHASLRPVGPHASRKTRLPEGVWSGPAPSTAHRSTPTARPGPSSDRRTGGGRGVRGRVQFFAHEQTGLQVCAMKVMGEEEPAPSGTGTRIRDRRSTGTCQRWAQRPTKCLLLAMASNLTSDGLYAYCMYR